MDICVTCEERLDHLRAHTGDGVFTPFKHFDCLPPTRAQEDAWWRDVNLRVDAR